MDFTMAAAVTDLVKLGSEINLQIIETPTYWWLLHIVNMHLGPKKF